MITVHEMPQRSPEWYAIRKGKATASQMSNIITPTGRASSSSLGFMRKLARECVIDDPSPGFDSFDMKWGREHEDEARVEFKRITTLHMDEVGFITNDKLKHVGISPDGWMPLINEGWEVKCPKVDTHVKYLMSGDLPSEYKLQVHSSIVVAEADSWHFMSYFPGLKPFIIEVERDEFTDKVEAALIKFNDEFQAVKQNIIDAISLPAVEIEEDF